MYKTRDLYLASTLLLFGHAIDSHERDGSKCIFHFNDSKELREIVQGYLYDTINVSPMKFQSAIKSVKTVIYS
ncbi:MAG: hypothetical protein GY861_28030 [bacterium]|nr:hypothetical protein [bacterium]